MAAEAGSKRRAPRGLTVGIAAVVVIGLVAVAVAVGYQFWSFTTVPDVTKLSRETAVQRLQQAGLAAEQKPSWTGKAGQFAVGTVLSQEPTAGTRVARASTVTFSYVAGSSEARVPTLAGKPFVTALAELKAQGLVPVGSIRGRPVPPKDPSHVMVVLSVEPTGGTVLERGASVQLDLSTNPGSSVPFAHKDLVKQKGEASCLACHKTAECKGCHATMAPSAETSGAAGSLSEYLRGVATKSLAIWPGGAAGRTPSVASVTPVGPKAFEVVFVGAPATGRIAMLTLARDVFRQAFAGRTDFDSLTVGLDVTSGGAAQRAMRMTFTRATSKDVDFSGIQPDVLFELADNYQQTDAWKGK